MERIAGIRGIAILLDRTPWAAACMAAVVAGLVFGAIEEGSPEFVIPAAFGPFGLALILGARGDKQPRAEAGMGAVAGHAMLLALIGAFVGIPVLVGGIVFGVVLKDFSTGINPEAIGQVISGLLFLGWILAHFYFKGISPLRDPRGAQVDHDASRWD